MARIKPEWCHYTGTMSNHQSRRFWQHLLAAQIEAQARANRTGNVHHVLRSLYRHYNQQYRVIDARENWWRFEKPVYTAGPAK